MQIRIGGARNKDTANREQCFLFVFFLGSFGWLAVSALAVRETFEPMIDLLTSAARPVFAEVLLTIDAPPPSQTLADDSRNTS